VPRCANPADGRAAGPAAVLLALWLAACGTPPPSLNPAQQTSATLSQSAARALGRGNLAQARTLYEGALAAAESVEDFQLAGAALLNLALVHARAGELAAGHARVDRILAAPQRYGAALQARAAARKALLYLDAPDLDAALRWADAAQAACAAPCELDAMLADLRAHVALQRGDAAAAAQLAARAAELAAKAEQPAEQASALRLLGRAHSQSGQTAEAAAALAQALAIDQRLGVPERVALDLLYAGENEQRRSQPAAAREFYERASVVYEAAGQRKAAESVRARIASVGGAVPNKP
jgi:tetratricopeptide (TPR) repeat protein